MPQHELETQSRNRFEAALLTVWVSRSLSPDYGLDYEVEIFEDDGSHTGDSFYVQVKARSDRDISKALRLWFPHEVVDYYQRQALPVLIVGYHGPTDLLCARWFHSFDPHYGGHHEKGITFVIDPERDQWNESTPPKIASDVRAFRRWRSGKLSLPVTFSVEAQGTLHGLPAAEILLRLRALAEGASDIIRLAPEPSTEFPTIILTEDKTVVDFQGVASATSHRTGYGEEAARSRFPYDVLFTVALAFSQIGRMNTAARLLRIYAPESSLIDDPEIVFRSIGCFVQSHRVLDALRMAEQIRTRTDLTEPVADMMFMAALAQASSMSSDEVEDVRLYLVDLARRADEAGDSDAARVAHYTLGNWLKANRRWDEAFLSYWRAVEWDAVYLERPYFASEFAGILFELGHFEHASDFYRTALEAGEEAIDLLLADALMHAGKYREALDMFAQHVTSDSAPWWRLKAWGLRGATKWLGIEEQDRDPSAANKIAGKIASARQDDEVERYAEQAFALDLLCPLAWFNLGVLMNERRDRESALAAFVLAGLLEPGDSEAWCDSTLIALSDEEFHGFFEPIVQTAFISLGQDFVRRLTESLKGQPAEFPVAEALAAVDECVRHIHRERPGFEIRFLLEGNKYESFHIAPPSDNPLSNEQDSEGPSE